MKCDTIADLERFLLIQEQAMGPTSAEVATTASKLADLYVKAGKLESAEPLYKRALQIRQNLNGFHRDEICESEEKLRWLLEAKTSSGRIDNPFHKSVAQSDAKTASSTELPKVGGPKNESATASQNNYFSTSRPKSVYAAGMLGDASTQSSDRLSVVPDPNRQRVTSPNLMQDAIKEAEVELDLFKQMVGQENPAVADMLTRLADLYCRMRMYSKMEPILVEALRIREACCGPDHISVSTELKNLARLYLVQERYAIAEPLFKRAIAVRERVFGRDHMRVADIEEQYAHLLRKTNRIQQAETLERHIEKVRNSQQDCVQPKQTNSIVFKSI